MEAKSVTIVNIIKETDDTKTFVLHYPGALQHIPYSAGQYVTLVWSSKNNITEKRTYSISKWDEPSNTFQITVKRIDNGQYSRMLFDHTKIGDELMIDHIAGFFTLPENLTIYEQLFFIIAGSGIAPAMPMIEMVLEQYPTIKIQLIYANRNADNTIFYDLLNQYQKRYSNQFAITYLFSQSNPINKARLNNTLLTKLLLEQLTTTKDKALFYTCGPIDFMDMVSITLLTENIPKAQIKKEVFYSEPPEIMAIPDDIEPHQVTLHFSNGTIKSLQVKHPHSILDTALELGIKMPYSCRSGQCGSCTGKIIKGKVFMSYNEVLTEADIAQGLTLTCTGFPIEGDVTIQY